MVDMLAQKLFRRRLQQPLPYQPGDQRMERRYAFVLRIWLTESVTPKGQTTSVLRGALQPINSNESLYFHSLRQLNDLLERTIEEESGSPSDAI